VNREKIQGSQNSGLGNSQDVLEVTTGKLSLDRLLSKSIQEVDKLYAPPESRTSDVFQPNSSDADEGKLSNRKLFIVLEDFLALIQCTGESEKRALEFLRQLRFLRPDLDISVGTLAYSREADSGGKYFCNLLSQVLSTTSFHVAQLRTGFSSEVHGILTVQEQDRVIRVDADEIKRTKRRSRSYHYKLLDRGIQFVPL